MKRRLLAFLLAFAMMLSLMPVTAFAAGEETEELTAPSEVAVEEVTSHAVTLTAGEGYTLTGEAAVTDGSDYTFTVAISEGYEKSEAFAVKANGNVLTASENGSYTIANVTADLTITVEGVVKAQPVSHTVTLTAGEGYTLTGEAAVTDGSDYTFTVAISEGYEMEDSFVVKANGEVLTAGESGGYTVANVTADLTITVEGVKKTEVPAKAGLSSLKFGDGNSASKAGAYEIAPAFDPAVKEYSLLVADNYATAYAWAVRGADMSSSAKITAQWTSVDDGSAKSVTLTSGKSTGQILTKFMKAGDVTNTATFTVTDGDFTDTYTVKLARVPSLTALSLDGIKFNESFSTSTRAYTANTAKDSVTVNVTPRAESYKVTYNGKAENTVALDMGENTIEVVVTNASGNSSTYTIKVTRVEAVQVDFSVNPSDAKVTVWDSLGSKVAPENGKYSLMSGSKYSYLVQKDGYVSQKNNFTLSQSGTIEVQLETASENPALDKTIYAQWANFRNGSNHLGITNAKTPYAPEDAELLWAQKYGTGWAAAPGSPIIVDGDIVTYVGSTIRRLDRMTGEVVATGEMAASSSFSIVPPTYADGMIFVGLSGGRIQAFNAKTLQSLWLYTDELGGQPNCPITYKDGYIYAGFWNSEDQNANFVCINTIDEKHDETNEEKFASWSYTRAGGFYWAGAYATDRFVVVGTDDGASGYNTEGASLLVFDRLTGELIDSHNGIRGDIRSNVSYDPDSDRVFFSSKGGVLSNAKIDWSTGKITDFKQVVITDANGNEYAMSTCTPSVYNGRIYIGVAGTSQFGANSGHAIAVYDLNADGSMTKAYAYAILGYPQTSAMVTTAYASTDGYVYIYLPYNYTPGGISVLKDKKGQTEPLTTTSSGYSEVFTPVGSLAQYCICSTIADEYGTIYYKNDSCYMMAITSKVESLEITQYPSSVTVNEDGTWKADGLKVVTKLKNGEVRDVTKYVTVSKNEETGGYVVSYTYGFDNDSYGLKTVTADIVDYKVTLPEGEGYTVTGETAVRGGENYTFTVTVAEGYEKTEDFAVKANDTVLTAAEDGTYTVEKVSADLTITVEGVVKQSAGHTVTLTPGTGYTLTGEATAADGADYTFTVTVAEGFVKNGVFAVKANDTELTANEDGSYTVKSVAEDVTITVEGVMSATANGLSVLKFTESNAASAAQYTLTPAFDPAVKEYTIYAPDTKTSLSVWTTLGEDCSSKAVINAKWTNQTSSTGAQKTLKLNSGKSYGQSMSGAMVAGNKGNTITITVTDGDYTATYTVNVIRTDPTLSELSLDSIRFKESFKPATKNYTASTADESVTVKYTPRSKDYTVTINGGTNSVIPLEMGQNVIEVTVQNARGEKNTYTITVTRVEAVNVTLNVTPAKAKVTLTDSRGTVQTPDSNGVYRLMSGATYYYKAVRNGYLNKEGSFTPTESGSVDIVMEESTAKPVTVYFSFSHDANFEFCNESGAVMALKKVTVPYFDLANYGMEDFYFASEDYGPASGDPTGGPGSALDPGTAEFAFGKITMLHLFIYSTEVYYCGIDPEDAGQGYLYDSGLLGTDLFAYSGSAGSIFLNNIWNYDLNLNYYLNYEYPLASAGWGSTCDQILLHDDDIVTLGHFTDWSFFSDSTSVFNHIEADNVAPVQGDKINLSLIHDGADMFGTYNTAHSPVTYGPDVYCVPVNEMNSGDVTTWTLVGTADEEGKLTVDTSELAPGEYLFAVAGQPGMEYTDAICSTPGGVRVTIQPKPVVKGDMDGDGVVNALDVMALYNAISDEETLDLAVADFNGDGVVNVLDVMAIYASIQSGD